MIAFPSTLEDIRDEVSGNSFPCDRLVGLETALVLFAAGFFGKQDAYWVADAGLHATCVDTDPDRMDAMAAVYPTRWDFIEADVYSWAPASRSMSRHWDVVTVDCPSGHFDRCADIVEVWCALARHLVVLGTGNHQVIQVPGGWKLVERRRRSNYDGGVYWAVLERA